ncbi:MAG: polysaccharide pyruvyl transferase CsaB [Prochloraceae cyanobacterium]
MKAIICGYYGKGNSGDEALLISLLQMLPKNVTPIVLSGNPQQTKQKYQVETCDRASAFPILKAFDAADLFIWGGGSLIQDVTSILSPFYYIGLMSLAQQKGLKTIAWSQGIGPLKYPWTRSMTKKLLQHCTAISVRDRASAKLLSDWQIPFTLAPDPVFALKSKSVKGLWETKAPRVAVILRPHPQLTPDRLENLTKAIVSFQKATDTYILLVPFQPVRDLEIARGISKRLPPSSHQIITLEDPRELKGLFCGVEMTIAMRLHGLIMAASEGCRCFAIGYDPKVTQLKEQLDFPGWELKELPEDPNLICTAWLEAYANSDPLSPDKIQFLIDRALINRELLVKICDRDLK